MQVTIPEAAQLLRLSEYTIRRRLRTGELTGQQVVSPGGFAWMVEVPDELAQDSPMENSYSGEIAAMQALLARAEAQIASQETQLQAKDRQLESKDRQIEQLHVLLQQAQTALSAPREERQSWWRRLLHRNGR
jgi:chromosome segregation ATPase